VIILDELLYTRKVSNGRITIPKEVLAFLNNPEEIAIRVDTTKRNSIVIDAMPSGLEALFG
jgi:hypothetical protein